MGGCLYVVGIGPGDEGYLTGDAVKALEKADLIVGYSVYIKLLPPTYKDKDCYSTGMGGEVERCRYAVDHAVRGENVAVVCGGDPGVYGMASLIYELAYDSNYSQMDLSSEVKDNEEKYNKSIQPLVDIKLDNINLDLDENILESTKNRAKDEDEENDYSIDIIIVPGITAVLSGAAVLGAPICNDFAVISLSTALTPWERIERRLIYAAEGDFAIVLYNPMSKHRPDTLKRACEVISMHAGEGRIAGYVRNIGREDMSHGITTVGELGGMELDMFTTVFIGSSATKNINGKMVTGREYRL